MDPLSKFVALQMPVNISENQQEQIVPPEVVNQASSAGIASTTDSFEAGLSTNFFPTPTLTDLSSPMSIQDGLSQQLEQVDASSIFEMLDQGSGISAKGSIFDAPGIDPAIAKPEIVPGKWDVVQYLLNEAYKSQADGTAMYQKLLNLPPEVRKEVLTQLDKQGDFDRVLSALNRSNDPNVIADLMACLTKDFKNDPEIGPFLSRIYTNVSQSMSMTHDVSKLKRYVSSLTPDQIASLPADLLQQMQTDALNVEPMMDLNSWEKLQQAKYIQNGDDPSKAHDDLTAKLDSIPDSDPNHNRYMTSFPYWGEGKISELLADPQKFDQKIRDLMYTNEDGLSNLLSFVIKHLQDSQDSGQISPEQRMQIMQESANVIQDEVPCAFRSDLIAKMVNSLGDRQQALEALSKLSPNILIDLSLTMDANHSDVKTIIDDALEMSKSAN